MLVCGSSWACWKYGGCSYFIRSFLLPLFLIKEDIWYQSLLISLPVTCKYRQESQPVLYLDSSRSGLGFAAVSNNVCHEFRQTFALMTVFADTRNCTEIRGIVINLFLPAQLLFSELVKVGQHGEKVRRERTQNIHLYKHCNIRTDIDVYTWILNKHMYNIQKACVYSEECCWCLHPNTYSAFSSSARLCINDPIEFLHFQFIPVQ